MHSHDFALVAAATVCTTVTVCIGYFDGSRTDDPERSNEQFHHHLPLLRLHPVDPATLRCHPHPRLPIQRSPRTAPRSREVEHGFPVSETRPTPPQRCMRNEEAQGEYEWLSRQTCPPRPNNNHKPFVHMVCYAQQPS